MEEYNSVFITLILAILLSVLGYFAKSSYQKWIIHKLTIQQLEDARLREKEARMAAVNQPVVATPTPDAQLLARIQLLQKLLDMHKSIRFEDAERANKLEDMTLKSLEHCHVAFQPTHQDSGKPESQKESIKPEITEP
ncbi:MAG: hypothetical protein K9J37_13670 [Saprospiraceae bacterium]|nr:hypothetical protein [Saprospiraceae bacterium]MCF8250958.1 hypothetical protein [Saprospiraceae bacterium]MCF8281935.1 hypothetical protein [Bacteroidales bacterium]MCF8311922.1 hypothetical protein [Saprospiraceae bacterium]MCF8441930.1 hypothetical protein [Saprospiraceae bacterium]